MLGIELPTTAGADITDQVEDAFASGWPIFATMIGLGVVVKLVRTFTR